MDAKANQSHTDTEPASQQTAKLTLALNSLGISGAGFATQLIGLPLGFLNAYILGPTLLGVLKLVGLVFYYNKFSGLGLLASMVRQYPIAEGRGDWQACQEIIDVCCTITLVTVLIYVGGFIGLYMTGWDFDGGLDTRLVVIIAVWIVGERIFAQLQSYSLARGKFGLYANNSMLRAICIAMLSLPLLLLYGLPGVLAGGMLGLVLTVAWYWFRSGFSYRFYFNWQRIHSLAKVTGFLFFRSLTQGIRSHLDLTILAFMGDSTMLGLYGFAHGALMLVENAPKGLQKVLKRHILLQRGERGVENLDYFAEFLGKHFAAYLLISMLGISAVVFFYNFIVLAFLPKMLPSLAVLSVLVWGFVFRQQHSFLQLLMDLSEHLPQLVASHVLFLLFQLGLTLLFFPQVGFIGAAYAFVVTEVVYCLVTYLYFYHRIGLSRKLALGRYLILGLGHLVIAASLVLLAKQGAYYITGQSMWYGKIAAGCLVMAVQTLVMTSLVLVVYGLIFRRVGFFAEVYTLGRELTGHLRLLSKNRSGS
jgi:O-antigen/teichoic acid export membrane protein